MNYILHNFASIIDQFMIQLNTKYVPCFILKFVTIQMLNLFVIPMGFLLTQEYM